MGRGHRAFRPEPLPLGQLLRRSLSSAPAGWLVLPAGEEWGFGTDALMVELDGADTDQAVEDDDRVMVGGREFVPVVDGHTLHAICQGAARLQRQPSDATLLEAFSYYVRFDAFLPFVGAPDPPPFEEIVRRQDVEFWELLGAEDPDRPCRRDGCMRGAVRFSVLCKVHHFESVKHKPCPFPS
jgi:hypothetical protein